MGYSKQALKGISWTGFLSLLTKSIGFIEVIILARILFPAQFGAYAISLLALGFLETVTETGVNIVLIQEKNIDRLISSAWFVSIIRGVFISIFLFLTAPLISKFFNSPEALRLLYLISIIPLIRGFINPSIIKLQKELFFNKFFWYKLSILILDTVVSILVTFITKNPVGIVVGLLSGVSLELLISFVAVKPIPGLSFEKKYINLIFNKGKWITGTTVFEYLFSNIDNAVVGKLLGTFSLGVYQLAYSISVMPLSEIGKVFMTVTVPIFVKISNEGSRLRNAFIKTFFIIIVLCIPGLIVFIFIPHLFLLILGQKWDSITPLLPILGMVGFIRAISIYSNSLFLSTNQQNRTTIISFVSIALLLVLIVPLVKLNGLVGAGLAQLLSVVVVLPLIFYFVFEIFKKSNQNSI